MCLNKSKINQITLFFLLYNVKIHDLPEMSIRRSVSCCNFHYNIVQMMYLGLKGSVLSQIFLTIIIMGFNLVSGCKSDHLRNVNFQQTITISSTQEIIFKTITLYYLLSSFIDYDYISGFHRLYEGVCRCDCSKKCMMYTYYSLS